MSNSIGGRLATAAWHLVVLTLVLLAPVLYRHQVALWSAPIDTMLQAAWGGLGYLFVAALGERAPADRAPSRVVVETAATVVLVFGGIGALPIIADSLPLSRALLLLAAAISLAALVVHQLTGRIALAGRTLAVVATVAVIGAGLSAATAEDFTVDTQAYLLSVRVHRSPLLATRLEVEGGGLAPLGDGFLLVTGSGDFSRVRVDASGGATFEPLALTSPANAAEFRGAVDPTVQTDLFRVVDIVAETLGDSVRVRASHHHWDATRGCFTLRVSITAAAADLERWTAWRPFFEAAPCLTLKAGARGLAFQGSASGGRMLLGPDGLLLTVGDHQYDGLNAPENLPQDPTSHYGKVVLVRPDGSVAVVSSGHRNPQGLAFGANGAIWETEHGPRGGDELNLIRAGGNYGWPWRSMGTEYALRTWPMQRPRTEALTEPTLSFVPSKGLSNLLEVSAAGFPLWEGSLLIGTLRARMILRVQLDGERPVYVEEIPLGFEVRDIASAPDGSLVIWTDQGALLTIRASADESEGAALALACTACHTLNQGQRGALGPNLFGVVGRRVGSSAAFNYSPALRSLGGRWTPERLDAFLANPSRYAPGTSMAFVGEADSTRRRQLIEYLGRVDSRR